MKAPTALGRGVVARRETPDVLEDKGGLNARGARGARGALRDVGGAASDAAENSASDDGAGATQMVVTAAGMRGGSADVGRHERSVRTARLLAQAAHADPEQRRELLAEVVELNARIADAVATRYRDRTVPMDDLRQSAYEGLIKAVQRYDPSAAEDLLTYAVPTIRGEVQRFLRDRFYLVRPPRQVHELNTKVQMAAAHLLEDLRREPSTAEVCDYLGLDEGDYHAANAAMAAVRHDSLDRELTPDGGGTLADILPDAGDVTDAFETVESRLMLQPALRQLKDTDRYLLHCRFIEQRSQTDIAAELGLSQTQVARTLGRILRDLRASISAEPDEPAARKAAVGRNDARTHRAQAAATQATQAGRSAQPPVGTTRAWPTPPAQRTSSPTLRHVPSR